MQRSWVRSFIFVYIFPAFIVLPVLLAFQNCTSQGFQSQLNLFRTADDTMSSLASDPPLVLKGKGLSQWIQENNLQNKDLVEIPAGVSLEIDGTANQLLDLGILQVKGVLRCPENGAVTLRVSGLQVTGPGALFECGTEDKPYLGRLNIELKPGTKLIGLERSFVVMNGGTLQLHGQTKSKWQRISRSVAPGDKTIRLTETSNWRTGDRVALAPTSFNPHEAEDAIIAAVSDGGRTLELQSPLKFKHWGDEQIYTISSRSWNLEERAEITNLTRQIRIMAHGDPQSMNNYGGHVMVMKTARAYVDSVEFVYMGQMGNMGSYPFHWHRVGEASGQYIRNSSIHNSFQRCVTVHGTNNTQVVDNVCYDHYGHGYFLEDGNETGNRIAGNLGMLTRKPLPGRNLLQSDIDATNPDRWLGPATFWISNPTNSIIGNVAAGSEGTGFWNSFVSALNCDENSCTVEPSGRGNVRPAFSATTEFKNNLVRSTPVGMSWDGGEMGDPVSPANPNNPNDRQIIAVHYQPPTMPVATGLTVSKSLNAGIYFRGKPYHFENIVLADNRVSVFFAYNQRVVNSAIIGYGRNRTTADLDYIRAQKGIGQIANQGAVWFYDGPLELTNVDFLNFPAQPIPYGGIDAAPLPFKSIGGADHFTSLFKGIAFSPEPQKRFNLEHNAWIDTPYSVSVRDLDGSLLGEANTVLVYDHPINRDASCAEMPNTNGLRCRYSPGMIIFPGLDKQFQLIRSDGAATRALDSIYPEIMGKNMVFNSYHSKVHLFPGFEYTVQFGPRMQISGGGHYSFIWHTESLGQLSPVLRFKDVGLNCSASRAASTGPRVALPSLTSLDELRAAQGPAFFAQGQDLYLRAQSLDMDNLISSERVASTGFRFQCGSLPTIDPLTSPLVFDAAFYRDQNSGLSSVTEEELIDHWRTSGIPEGQKGIQTFSASEYLSMYPDLKSTFGENNYAQAIRHYVTTGNSEGRRGLWLLHPAVFHPFYYQSTHQDFYTLSDETTLIHWLKYGVGEGRQSSPLFNVREYAQLNSDVAQANGEYPGMVKHYAQFGYNEGRAARTEFSPLIFDLNQYSSMNPDLSAAGLVGDQIKAHWISYGISEGRQASSNFNVKNYLARYPDLQNAFGPNGFAEAARHFVRQGSSEGRNGK